MNFAIGDRVYNLRPFFGKRIPTATRELMRRGTVLCVGDGGWPWVRWDDGYECGVSPTPNKLRLFTAIDELAALIKTGGDG